MKVVFTRPFECLKFTLLLLFLLFVISTEVGALSIVNQGPSAVDNYPPNNGVSVAVTTTITSGTTIQWGIRGQGGIEAGLGTITIPSGLQVGFGTGTVPNGMTPGTYTIFAREGAQEATDGTIVVKGPPHQPTKPPVITKIDDKDVPLQSSPYRTKKTEINVFGTCEAAGETVEIYVNGTLWGSIYTTGTNWAANAVTIPNNGAQATVHAKNAAGESPKVYVLVDTKAPTFKITYDKEQPFTPGQKVKVTLTAYEGDKPEPLISPVDFWCWSLESPDPSGLPNIVVNMTPVPPGSTTSAVWQGEMEIKNTHPNGQYRVEVHGWDTAEPAPGNLGTIVQEGGIFRVNTAGPSSANAWVKIHNDDQYIANRTLDFKWGGFTHPLGMSQMKNYWYIAVADPNGSATPPNGTAGWTQFTIPQNPPAEFSATTNATSDGTWSVFVKAEDQGGQFSGYVKDSILVDTTGPVAQNPSPANGAQTNLLQQTWEVELTDQYAGVKVESITVTIVNGTYSGRFGVGGTVHPNASPALSYRRKVPGGPLFLMFDPKLINLTWQRGSVRVTIEAPETVDNINNPLGGTAGSQGVDFTWTFNVTTNASAPVPANPKPKAGLYVNNKRPPISLYLYDENLIDTASVRFNVRGITYTTKDTALKIMDPTGTSTASVLLFTPPADMADGTVECSLIECKDRVGNAISAPYTWTFYIDTTPPVASDPKPANNQVTPDSSQIITLKLEDAWSGLDTGTNSVKLRILSPTTKNADGSLGYDQTFMIDDPAKPGLTYNPNTKLLTFNPRLVTGAGGWTLTFGSGTVTVRLLAGYRDRARTIDDQPAPNAAKEDYVWSFRVGTSGGPIASDIDPKPGSATNKDPFVLRIVLADPDGVDKKSMLIDVKGYTFRDGDLAISWTKGTSSVMTGTHDVLLWRPPSSDFLTEGTVTATLRECNDINGNPLQNKPVDLSFMYDVTGPVAKDPKPADGEVIWDKRQVITVKLEDNASGVDVNTIIFTITHNGRTDTYSVVLTPSNLFYNPGTKVLTFVPTTDWVVDGKTWEACVSKLTKDRAKNPLNATKTNKAGSDYRWIFKVAGTGDRIKLTKPDHNATVNPYLEINKFTWEPTTAPVALYRITFDRMADFGSKPWSRDVGTNTSYQAIAGKDTFENGLDYYWKVEAYDSAGMRTASSETRRFICDTVPPKQLDILAVIDYKGLNPNHVNTDPINKTTYVRARDIRLRVKVWEPYEETKGYRLKVYHRRVLGDSIEQFFLGQVIKEVCPNTCEVDFTLPDEDREYIIYAIAQDPAGNEGVWSLGAKVRLDRTIPKIDHITVIDTTQAQNAYITSGQIEIQVVFDDAIDILPLNEYRVPPVFQFDPAGAGGTGPVSLTNLEIRGKTLRGIGYIPYGQDSAYNGKAHVIVGGIMDKAWNGMEGGVVTIENKFEIDTAPKFDVSTFINPVDENNIMINIQASEPLQPGTVTLRIIRQDLTQVLVPVHAMERELYAASYQGVIGQNSIRVTGNDTRNNIGYYPTAEQLGSSIFLVAGFRPGREMAAEAPDIGLKVTAGGNLFDRERKLFILPTSETVGKGGKNDDIPELESCSTIYRICPETAKPRDQFEVTLPYSLNSERKLDEKKLGIYVKSGKEWKYAGGTFEKKAVRARLSEFGKVGVFADMKPPTVRDFKPSEDEKLTTNRPEFSAYVSDGGSGVTASTIKLLIDGVAVPVEYDQKTCRLSYIPPVGLPEGEKTVTLMVSDRAGNTARTISRKLFIPKVSARIKNAISYPNPTRTLATISFSVDGLTPAEIDECTVKIFDVAGRVVARPVVGPGRTPLDFIATWDLSDEDGNEVANGVYIFRATVKYGEASVQSTGKIAVLR